MRRYSGSAGGQFKASLETASRLPQGCFWPVEIITEFLVVRMASPMVAVKALGELLLN
jgi:hypothetical protein